MEKTKKAKVRVEDVKEGKQIGSRSDRLEAVCSHRISEVEIEAGSGWSQSGLNIDLKARSN